VIAGVDTYDPTASPTPVPNYLAGLERGIDGLRFGFDPKYNSRGVDRDMVTTVRNTLTTLRAMGAELREVTFPKTDVVVEEWRAHCGIETAFAHRHTYPKQKEQYGPALASLIDLGLSLSAGDYQRILLNRYDFSGKVKTMFQDIDILVVPAQGQASPTLEQRKVSRRNPEATASLLRFTAPFDLTVSPALTMPSGFTKTGLPIAIQFVGRHFEEDILIRASHAYQRETDWHNQHPRV
jgi:amidase